MRFRFTGCLLAGALTPALIAASVHGRVYDPSGGVVPKATVVLRELDSNVKYTQTSNGTGDFEFTGVAQALYELEVLSPGFATYRVRSIDLKERPVHRMYVILRVGAISESLEIRGEGKPVAQPPPPVRVGGAVQATKIVYMLKPMYPPEAKAAGIEGTVVFHATINEEGNIMHLQELSGADVALVEAARAAVSTWRYEPTLLNGRPVAVETRIDINFTLAP